MRSKSETPPTVVGIAASAGGLEAMSLFLQNLPKGLNCAFVLAQHMSPSHESMLVKLLSRETALDVREIGGPVTPAADTIYIPPPGSDVGFAEGALVVLDPSGHPATPKPSADRLFKALADALGARCMGLVLSGTGSDGSYGVQAIREAGGITLAQEPSSAKYDSMPVSAVRTGCVDLVLTPQQIGQHLEKILSQPRDLEELKKMGEEATKNADLFQILLAHTMVDFRQYKESTINRRVHRRMVAKGIATQAEYVDFCRRSQEEVEALYKDLLISVTRFFRDGEQFAVLRDVLQDRVSAKPGAKMRIWVPGCATGEEAYSIAALYAEAAGGLEALGKDSLQIFATDIDEHALAVGRRGSYPRSATDDIPPDLLEKYFEISGDRVIVKQSLRNCVMFTRHNIFQDAPFMSIDLVSIRNVLIYFDNTLQDRVLSRIQYALSADGMLFLGTSETAGTIESHFVQLDPAAKIYAKRSTPPLDMTNFGSTHAIRASRRMLTQDKAKGGDSVHDWSHFHALVGSFAETAVLVTAEGAVLKVYGDLAPFSQITDSVFKGFSLRVLKAPLSNESTTLVLVALKKKKARTGQWHRIEGRDFNHARLVAYPLEPQGHEEPYVLLAIETEMRSTPEASDEERTDYLTYIETELSRTREALNVTMEQLQTSNEELQSLNEELQSSNEELQSTNEELETSNEELQSTNEELITVNEELIVNSTELQRTTAELNGIVDGLPTTMLMLDQGLLIRHASRQAIEQFALKTRGQSMGHISQCHLPEGFPPVVDLCSQALLNRKFVSRQFSSGQRRFLLTIAPLISVNDELIGLVVMVTSLESSIEISLNHTLRRFGQIGTWRVQLPENEVEWSEEVYQIHGLAPEEGTMSLERAIGFFHPDDRAAVRGHLEKALEERSGFHFTARIIRADGRITVLESSGTVVMDRLNNMVGVVGVVRDFSRMQTENMLLRHYNEITSEEGLGVYSYDIRNGVNYWNPTLYDLLGVDRTAQPEIETALRHLAPSSAEKVRGLLKAAMTEGEGFEFEGEIARNGGERIPYRSKCQVVHDEAGEISHVFGVLRRLE
ncbi:chemotaxis protein CheB [Vannielia litorea]|uniref:chemotaxis protein CheB n=1 Tax=Vannielia litorea TaxID=1217970 RepID=UPI001BCCDD84|nr:chemotaxis protein CheB [Vannielia litorea]MBS8225817.1 PAS domain S-box protein [Vannielia litorea]